MNGGAEGRILRAGIPSSASAYLRLLFLIRGKQEQRRALTPRRRPHEALLVGYSIKSFYLLVFICIFFFFKKCGLGQCSKTTVTQTGGRSGRTERPRRRAKGHLRKNTYQKDVGVFACYEQIKRLRFFFFFLFAPHVVLYLRVVLRCSEF